MGDLGCRSDTEGGAEEGDPEGRLGWSVGTGWGVGGLFGACPTDPQAVGPRPSRRLYYVLREGSRVRRLGPGWRDAGTPRGRRRPTADSVVVTTPQTPDRRVSGRHSPGGTRLLPGDWVDAKTTSSPSTRVSGSLRRTRDGYTRRGACVPSVPSGTTPGPDNLLGLPTPRRSWADEGRSGSSPWSRRDKCHCVQSRVSLGVDSGRVSLRPPTTLGRDVCPYGSREGLGRSTSRAPGPINSRKGLYVGK